MAKTVDSQSSSYLSATECLKRVDWRVFADLCSDDGTRLFDQATVAGSVNFLALLDDASGMVEQACFVAKAYTHDDLTALVAAASVGRAALYRLIARLAVVLAYERRPDLKREVPATYQTALDDLQMLREGARIFSFTETQEAGLTESHVETPAEVVERGGTVVLAERFFGTRGRRRDPAGGRE